MPRVSATPAAIQEHLDLLAAVPPRIAQATAGLDEARLRWSPASRVWPTVEILAHLRAGADLWTHSIYALLAEDSPTLPLLDERRWAKVVGYADGDFAAVFQAYALQRTELGRALPHEPWPGGASIGGRTHTVFSQARRMALHEVEHCAQRDTLLAQARMGGG